MPFILVAVLGATLAAYRWRSQFTCWRVVGC